MALVSIMIIASDQGGDITVNIGGPINGKEGIQALLDAAKEMVEQGVYNDVAH